MIMLYFNQVILILILIKQRPAIGAGLIDKSGITVTSSSTHIQDGNIPWGPDLAVDGDATRNPNHCSCCAATRQTYEPWYKVDLGRMYNIQFVDVIGRGGDGDSGSGHTLLNMRITYGINTYDETEMFTNSAAVFVVYHNLSTSVFGRYMELKLVGTYQYFIICELFVYSECDDGRYGRDCTTCGACLGGAPCNKADGTCTSCAAGYKGTKCDQETLFNTVAIVHDGMNNEYGVYGQICLASECFAGEYGPDCMERCGNCQNDVTCTRFDGSCTECQQGYMPPLCKECEDGRYGRDCVTCGDCLNGAPCNKVDGTCTSCAAGYKGTKCDQECFPGEYGPDCTERCGNCQNGVTCNRFDGSCNDCQPGYMTPLCKDCLDGLYGENCDWVCGDCLEGIACDSLTGVCLQGCSNGYNGTQCNTRCPVGTFGKDCMSSCGNCNHGDVCRFDNGHCERGCEPGLQPPTCIQECSHGHYGANCIEQCGFCKDNVTCNRFDGSCVECAGGYAGVMCKQKLHECICNNFNDDKGQVLAATIGGTFGAILFLEAVIAIVILLWRKRSKDKHHNAAAAATTTEGFYEMPDRNATEKEHLYGAALAQQIAESNHVYVNDRRQRTNES